LSEARRRRWLASSSTAFRVLGLVTAVLSAAPGARADVPDAQLPISEVSRAIRTAVGTGAAVSGPITPKERAQLTVLYDAGGFALSGLMPLAIRLEMPASRLV